MNQENEEQRYRLFVDQVRDYAIFMLDEEGRISSWNEGARRIKGYEAREIIGQYFSVFYPEEDIACNKPANELRIARLEGKYEEEGWRLRKDGTRFWANVVITPFFSPKGHLVGFSKVTRDLTERKAGERALLESNERYRMLAEQLRFRNAELSLANQELEQFTSIVSHDLQEPIRTIKSFLQLIGMKLESASTGDLQAYLGKAFTAADRMKDLILKLLHYSQLDKTEIVREPVPVRELFQEALHNLKGAMDDSRARVSLFPGVETIEGDRIQLVQLVQNLLGNALKFTRDKAPEVHLRCERNGEGRVVFSVSDNGIGIENEDFNKIFELFRRLNTGDRFPGTGIGLAICKKIVERHKGRLWLESTPGKGTTFYFTVNEKAPHYEEVPDSTR